MKASMIVVLVLVVLFFLGLGMVGCGVSIYNGMVTKDETVNTAWSQVENQYQRRFDLIPNLVEIVKGYATHEKSLFIEVAQARASVGSMKLTPEALKDPKAFSNFQKAQDGLSSVLSRLMMVTENYPTLKANEGFLKLQSSLEETENGIANERRKFNITAQDYNTTIRRFPASVFAGMFSFKERPYFQADEAAKHAPKVKF